MTKRIYLDFAAATPMAPEVLGAMLPYFEQQFYNPSATYLAAKTVKSLQNKARADIANLIGARPGNIIFTAGATEANNLAIRGIMDRFPDFEVLVSSIEHESVLEPARLYASREIPVDASGRILLNKLSNLINDKTVLVSVMLVNNEFGTIQALREISDVLEKVRQERIASGNKTPIYLHTDAAQAGNYLDLHVSRLGVDLMSVNGGKIYGPKQSGFLYVKSAVLLKAQIVGGGQEFGLRSGTENVAGCIGLAEAFKIAQNKRIAESERIIGLRQELESAIEVIGGIKINGSPKHRAPHISSLTFPESDNERLMMELDELGVECAVGSACSASNDEPSHALKALGLELSDINSTLRFSFGKNTKSDDITAVSEALAKILASNR
ncbi:cysteine desulfurase [Candidatus Saccharibacteria bacterium]|nr:cysteine desulfurase [Candidatus Saccharibacteria bacterium]